MTNPASVSLTTPSTAANSSRIRVSWSTNRRARLVPLRWSYWTRDGKKTGAWNRSKSATPLASSQYRTLGWGAPLE